MQSSAFFAKLVGEDQQLGVYLTWFREKAQYNLFAGQWMIGWISRFHGLVSAVAICC
jgi:hypothetical protein